MTFVPKTSMIQFWAEKTNLHTTDGIRSCLACCRSRVDGGAVYFSLIYGVPDNLTTN